MKNEIHFLRWCTWIIFVLGIIVALVFKYAHAGTLDMSIDSNMIIMLIFFVFVFCFFLRAFLKFGIGNKLIMNVNIVTEQIKTWKDNGSKPHEIMGRIISGEISFDNDEMKNALEQYKQDVKDMMNASGDTYLDIDAYINNSIIDKEIRTYFLNQISGTMTGLGILGTFIGLSIGLNSFNLSGTSSDITNQIQPLMEGIKVAFHTSIVGIFYSIFFNLIYRRLLTKYHNEVNTFLTTFHKCVIPISDNGTESTMIKYQKKIEALLERQLEESVKRNIAESEQNKIWNGSLDNIYGALNRSNNLVGHISEEVSGSFTRVMNDVVVPEIRKMGKIVEEFAKNTHKDQVEELSRLVNTFVQEMKKALGSSFEDLASIIKETNEWQKKSLDEMQNVLDKVNATTVDLVTIDGLIEDAIKSVSDYSAEIEKMQEAVNRNLESLNVQCDLNNDIIQSQTQELAEINKRQAALQYGMSESIKQITECSEKTTKYVADALEQVKSSAEEVTETITSSTEEALENIRQKTEDTVASIETLSTEVMDKLNNQIEDVNELDDQVMSDISDAADRLGSVVEDLDERMQERIKETFITFDQQLTHIVSHLASVLQEMEKVSKSTKTSYDGISGNIEDQFNELQSKLEEYLEYADKLHHDISNKWNQYRQISLEEKQ